MIMGYHQSRVLITGGLGFIGSHLARRLVADGARVTIIDNLCALHGANVFNIRDIASKVSVNPCDVRQRHVMEAFVASTDFLFQLAGQTSHLHSMVDPLTDMEINVEAQLSLLEICRRRNPGIKIVVASTRQVYGKPLYLPVDERHPLRPVDINGIHKLTAEQYYNLYHELHGINSCVLRLTNTYGPGMRICDASQCFVGSWIRALIEGEVMRIFGDGAQVRDFNHVDDCVEALLLAGANGTTSGKTYNLGSGEHISLLDLARKMATFGDGGAYECIPFPPERKRIDIGDYYGDISLIRNELHWSPAVGLNEGLQGTVAYYRQHYHQYVRMP
ncbi:MAG: SDR family NAD(P)-dependent oxidoreductase [Magnetococcales bacterium]|nr:SDR family NAD(P)-dependent oxidoreductase [Magnetococcales bacterium]